MIVVSTDGHRYVSLASPKGWLITRRGLQLTTSGQAVVRHGPIPLSTAHWDLFLSIEQSPSLVRRMRNDRCVFNGETAVPHSAVCRRHDSGAELLLRVSQNVVVIRGSTTPDAS